MRILAISGSLRTLSTNMELLKAAALMVPEGVEFVIFEGIGQLPHFNPDDEVGPQSVADYRAQLISADAVLICSPEYAHGVAGVLKNALDWVVGSGELVEKPVATINAQPRSTHAQASLQEILTVMSARVITDASIALLVAGRKLNAAGIVAEPELANPLRRAISALIRSVLHPA